MLIDIITIGLLLMALYKGWRRGLIVAVLSFLALVLGVIAALKLSAVTARWLEGTVNVSAKWMPVLAFLLVFIVVVVLVNLIARLLEHTAECCCWAD
ncbi:MAG: CvpA family protein [Flavihumibacter sp.]